LGVDRSANAIRLAGRCGAPALPGDVFQPLLGIGCWQTVLLIDGKVGLGVGRGGRCVAEFDAEAIGIRASVVRPESAQAGRCVVSLGLRRRGLRRSARRPARLRMGDVRLIGERVIDGMAVS
jgi:hypothetical protein